MVEVKKTHTHHHHANQTSKNLALAFALNLVFCVVELAGGLFTNSMAILSDAVHDFGDSIALGLAWYLQRVSARKPDRKYTYGYKRYSTLSAFITAMILLFGSGVVLYESIDRLLHPVNPNATGMLVLAIAGVLVNGFAMLRLQKGHSLNERAVSLHMLEDVLGWVAVLVVSIVMQFVQVPILDPLLSIGISIFMLFNVYRSVKQSLRVLLQGKPEEVDNEELLSALRTLPGVFDLHDWHVWSLDNDYLVSTVHLVMNESATKKEQQDLRSAAHMLLSKMGIQHATIEIESVDEACEWCEHA